MGLVIVALIVAFIFSYAVNRWVTRKLNEDEPRKQKVDENIVVEKKEKQVQDQPSSPTVKVIEKKQEVKEEVPGERERKVSDRTLVIAFAVMLLFILYLFALNNRYHIDNRYIYDKWLNRYTYQGYHEWNDWVE